tara:strand:+ start:51 stop:164 length:114 start_codon:yes stop_codon:yes gene_type:complete
METLIILGLALIVGVKLIISDKRSFDEQVRDIIYKKK